MPKSKLIENCFIFMEIQIAMKILKFYEFLDILLITKISNISNFENNFIMHSRESSFESEHRVCQYSSKITISHFMLVSMPIFYYKDIKVENMIECNRELKCLIEKTWILGFDAWNEFLENIKRILRWIILILWVTIWIIWIVFRYLL